MEWWRESSSRRRHTRCLSDWSSDVCSSDLSVSERRADMATSVTAAGRPGAAADANFARRLVQWAKGHRQATAYLGIIVGVGAVLVVWNLWKIGRASWRERGENGVVAGEFKQKTAYEMPK